MLTILRVHSASVAKRYHIDVLSSVPSDNTYLNRYLESGKWARTATSYSGRANIGVWPDYQHCRSSLLTERIVKEIVRDSIAELVYEGAMPDEEKIAHFIITIRRTNGLFVESGQGLFSFMHRTLPGILCRTISATPTTGRSYPIYSRAFSVSRLREPLLLAIADKSGQDKEGTQ